MGKPVMAVMVNSLVGDGAERIALTAFRQLKKRGKKVVLICLEREEGYSLPEEDQVFYLTDFEKISNPFVKVFWLWMSLFRLHSIIRQEKIQFIQSHISRSNCINAGVKYLGARHYAQLIVHSPVRFNDARGMKRLKAGLFTFFYKKADEIVYISKMIQLSTDQLLKLYRFPVFQRVVYNPHGLSRIKELATLEPERFSFKKGKRYIVSVCRLANFKGVHYIIQALYEVKKVRTDVELLIIGEGEEMTALRELVRRLDIESSVHFLGYCSNPFTYISRSDLYIMASETEGLPNVIIEALACGTPVVSSDCISGPREILSPGSDFTRILSNAIEYAAYGVLYPVGNTGLLAEAMLRLLSDETLRNYYTQKGLIRAEDYAEELIANQYLSHFNIT